MKILHDVFISYSHQDSDLAREMASDLHKLGMRYFLMAHNIGVGEWEEQVREGIESSKYVVLLMTPNSKKSQWVLWEAATAWGLRKTIIPALAWVKPNTLLKPIRKFQSYPYETNAQRQVFISRLVKTLSSNSNFLVSVNAEYNLIH